MNDLSEFETKEQERWWRRFRIEYVQIPNLDVHAYANFVSQKIKEENARNIQMATKGSICWQKIKIHHDTVLRFGPQMIMPLHKIVLGYLRKFYFNPTVDDTYVTTAMRLFERALETYYQNDVRQKPGTFYLVHKNYKIFFPRFPFLENRRMLCDKGKHGRVCRLFQKNRFVFIGDRTSNPPPPCIADFEECPHNPYLLANVLNVLQFPSNIEFENGFYESGCE